MKKSKNQGITLIALVVTIVVLLILAAVSISMLTGENGIIRQAQVAKEETRGGAVQEARDLWKSNKEMDNYTNNELAQTLEEVLDELITDKKITQNERKEIEETGKVTIGSRTIVFWDLIEINQEHILLYDKADNTFEILLDTDTIEKQYFEKWFNWADSLNEEEILASEENLYVKFSLGRENDTFEEMIEEAYNSGMIDVKYSNLREAIIGEVMKDGAIETEEEATEIYNNIINTTSNIYTMIKNGEKDNLLTILQEDFEYGKMKNPEGNICAENNYSCKAEIETKVFTINFLGKQYKHEINIDRYQIVNYCNNNYVLDVETGKFLHIEGGKASTINKYYDATEGYYKKGSVEFDINEEVLQEVENENFNYMVFQYGCTTYKCEILCNNIKIIGNAIIYEEE